MHLILLIAFPVFLTVITWINIKNTNPDIDVTVADHLWMAVLMAASAIAVYLIIRLGWLLVDAVMDLFDALGRQK